MPQQNKEREGIYICEFVSWIEHNGKVLFLNDARMKEKEQQMKVKYPDKSERQGHGAIRWYYGLLDNQGVNKECTDFIKLNNFPPIITKAIKTGKMTYGTVQQGLLLDAIYAKRQPERDTIYAKRQPEQDAIYTKWQQERDAIYTKWQPELDAINAKWQQERDALNTKWQPEWDAINAKYWKLFRNPKNRQPQWK